MATLWVEGNPIEFPPPPIPFLGLKRLITWLRQSQNACAEKKTDEHLLHVDSFAKKEGSNASFSASDSDAEAARCSRSASTFGVNSRTTFQHNELWLKLAKRKSALSEEEQSEDEDKENAVLELCRLYRHGQQVQDVNFHPKYPIFASCSEDRTVKMWEKNPVSDFSVPGVPSFLFSDPLLRRTYLNWFENYGRTLKMTTYGHVRTPSKTTKTASHMSLLQGPTRI